MTVNARKMATFPLLLELLTPFSVTEGNYKPTTGNWQLASDRSHNQSQLLPIREQCKNLHRESVEFYVMGEERRGVLVG